MNDAKRILSECKYIDEQITSLTNELDSLKSTLLKGPQLKEVNVQEGNIGLKDEIMVKMIVLNDEINAQIDKLIDRKRYVNSLIESVNDIKVETLLRKRYINYEPWNKIRNDLNISERTAMRLHSTGLIAINLKVGSKCSRMSVS